MTDAPERIWLWRDEPHGNLVASGPNEPYPAGSPRYVPEQALDAAREEGRREGLEEAAKVLQLRADQARGNMNRCRPSAKSAEWATIVAHLMNAEDDIRALIDKPALAQKEEE